MSRALNRWLIALSIFSAALLAGAIWAAGATKIAPGAMTGDALVLYAFAAWLAFALALAGLGGAVRRRYLEPAEAIARDLRVLLEAPELTRGLRLPARHALGSLPGNVAALVDEWRAARGEIASATASATERILQEKSWLELILLEQVREAVIVCSNEHRVLLYNHPAARLFRSSGMLGLGRSLFDLLADKPVLHALERLQHRLAEGSRDLGTRFVCASCDAGMMLGARVVLNRGAQGGASGYVLALEDISGALAEQRRSDAVRTAITQEMRRPVANLRAAAESLADFGDMDGNQRRVFQEVILEESRRLSERLVGIAGTYAGAVVGRWPMTEFHSQDLLRCIARRLHNAHGIGIAIEGEAQWMLGDSHSLMLVLVHLILGMRETGADGRASIAAGSHEGKPSIALRWRGGGLGGRRLDELLDSDVEDIPGVSARQVLEGHGSEPWAAADTEGCVEIRIPMQPALNAERDVAAGRSPPRPEFYDFELMHAGHASGDIAELRLRNLSYAVFDTETTGLRPAAGDRIIEIAAVCVTRGRVLTGETFDMLVDPRRPIPADSIRFHGITDDAVTGAPGIELVLPRFREFVGEAVLVAHNAAFDMKFLKMSEPGCGVRFDNPVLDTLLLSLLLEGEQERHSLDALCDRLDIRITQRHRALGDALATAHALVHFLDRLEARGITTFGQLVQACDTEAELRFGSSRG